MDMHILLNNGRKIPTIGIGTWNAAKDKVRIALEYAVLEAGCRHIDCASVYGNEKQIGEALQRIVKKIPREELFVTSKLWNTSHHPDNVEQACRNTLRDLQLDYLDLYLMHWGIAFVPGMDIEPKDKAGRIRIEQVSILETWTAMEKLIEKGLVKSIGVANFSTMMLHDLLMKATIQPAMNQIELHPYLAQTELVKYCHSRGVAVTAYSPLGSPGGLKKGEPVLLDDPVLLEIAKTHKKSPAQVLLRWALNRQTIPIPKSSSPERIVENMAVFDFDLSSKETSQLNMLDRHYRFVHPLGWWGIPYFS